MQTTNDDRATPATSAVRMEIVSYRDVFDLERRIYRIDRLRLNPAGVPLRGAIYFVASFFAAAAVGAVPGIGRVAGLLPWYLRYLAGPGLLAALGATVRVEGRPLHLALCGPLLAHLRPRQLCGFRACMALGSRWRPTPVVIISDGSGRSRPFRFRGPGTVLVRYPGECLEWRRSRVGRALGFPDLTVRLHAHASGPYRHQINDVPTTGDEHRLAAADGRALALRAGIRLEVTVRS